MSRINVVWMLHRRPVLINAILKIFSLCDMSKFHLSIMGCEVAVRANIDWKKIEKEARELGINATVMLVPRGEYDGSNYMKKIDLAKTLPYEYTIKYDEDVLMGPAAWDFLFDSLECLDHPKHLVLFPALSNGIPTIDYFIENNLTEVEQKEMRALLSEARMPDGLWGVDMSGINALLKQSGYDPMTYYSEVRKVNHHYRGIHPIRTDQKSQKYLNAAILKHLDGFFDVRDFYVKRVIKPYFCNSFFAIRTDKWKDVLDDISLYKDSFDEVQLNLYRENNGLVNLVIPNTFAIHCQYNDLFSQWIYDSQKEQFDVRDVLREYENEFWEEIINNLRWSDG